jgi:TRAP transporter TAXI family solute receptor
MKHGFNKLLVLTVTAGALLVGGALYAQQKAISIVTGGTGGVYYPLGGGMANILSKYIPGLQVTAEVTGGSVDNLKLISAGRAEVALSMVDAALDALNGVDKFTAGKVPVRTLLVLYPNRMHVVTIEATGINNMADLKGKRVSTGSPGSATEVMAFRILEAAGFDISFFRDLRRERLGVAESVNALKDRKIDAFFWVGGIPTAAVTDLGATPGMKIKLIDTADLVDVMNKKYNNLYSKGVIKTGSYPGQTKDNAVAVVQNILVANEKMPEELAYNVVKTLIEKQAELIAVHREAESMTLANQTPANSPVPFHPGAVKYFKEKGLKF